MRNARVRISLTPFASGCLPGLLGREIAEVERLLTRVAPGSDEHGEVATYLRQLKTCRDTVQLARKRAVGPKVWAAVHPGGTSP